MNLTPQPRLLSVRMWLLFLLLLLLHPSKQSVQKVSEGVKESTDTMMMDEENSRYSENSTSEKSTFENPTLDPAVRQNLEFELVKTLSPKNGLAMKVKSIKLDSVPPSSPVIDYSTYTEEKDDWMNQKS